MSELEITDKRKFHTNGEANPDYTPPEIDQKVFLVEIPCVYEDPKPIKNYVLVRQHAAETHWGGGRYVIPENARQNPNKGVVISIGPDVTACAEGDIVTFGRYNAEPIGVDGEDFQLVREEDLKLVERVTYAVQATN